MGRLSDVERHKLIAFLSIVTLCLAAVLALNRIVAISESAASATGQAKLADALVRLRRDPSHLSLTMNAECGQERVLRRLDARLIDPPDVLVLGMSDADHMSESFFRRDVRFYDAFISNSFFAYQREAFDDIAARRPPRIVLWDIRSGYLLEPGPEPAYDAPPDDDVWWYGPPHRAEVPPLHLGDLESLLSYDQTRSTFETLARRLASRTPPGGADEDDGAQFRVVPRDPPSNMNRWLADGSRVYKKERAGVLVPRGQLHVEEQRGVRSVNTARAEALETYVRAVAARVPATILYSPPVSPVVLEDARQATYLADAAAAVRAVAARLHVDYCDLSGQAARLGCELTDFYDELHLSRACDAKVVRELATGCAPFAGPLLAELVEPALLEAPP